MKLLLSAAFFLSVVTSAQSREPGVAWVDWSDKAFEQAKREKKFLILDLEAVWCHWCHVMEETTYHDPRVTKRLKEKFIAMKVDQDARPDVSAQYEEWGWPATIIFDSQGRELIKHSGYIEPDEFIAMVDGVFKDPTPGPSVEKAVELPDSKGIHLSPKFRAKMIEGWLSIYDPEVGGWGHIHKYLDASSVDYSMRQSVAGDKAAGTRAKKTLDGEMTLLDPVWGGVYQYSASSDWDEPHFEKIMAMQTDNLRAFAQASQLWKEPKYLKVAEAIYRYLETFLSSPEGGYYTSQDADLVQGQLGEGFFKLGDTERRKLGIPKVDTHRYARENGWVIHSLKSLYAATGNPVYLERAKKAADWVRKNRDLKGGGFRHDEKDASGPFLGDSLAMARAFLSLYEMTGEREWLQRARDTATFVSANFTKSGKAGFLTAKQSQISKFPPKPARDENVVAARFFNLLFHYTGDKNYRQAAESAMRFLVVPRIADTFPEVAVILADDEINQPPLHVTVVGKKDDAVAAELFKAAVRYPISYKRVEWWDAREGSLPNADVTYIERTTAAAFVCSATRCGDPILRAEDLSRAVEKTAPALW